MKLPVFFSLLVLGLSPLAPAQDGQPIETRLTHGPMLGKPTPESMTIWARTVRPGSIRIFYGLEEGKLDQTSEPLITALEDDNTGTVTLTGLQPNTRYYYRVEDHQEAGSFLTMPRAEDFKHPEYNPTGKFNFRFEFACGNNQRGGGDSAGVTVPVYDTLNREVRDSIHFAILNGDWLYEDRRDYPKSEWLHQVGIEADEAPHTVEVAPTVVGVWENYKTYLDRGRNLSEWHRHIPSYFTADDHELLNDIYGTGEVGYVNRRAVFRDIAYEAWEDYLAWANPMAHPEGKAQFGKATLKEGSDILEDPNADFTKLNLTDLANLHVHWGTDTAGVKDAALDGVDGDPNSAVYAIEEVLSPSQLRIRPAAKADTTSSYSIGKRWYGSFEVSNCEFFILDTRSHRDLHDVDNPTKPGASMLGKQQFQWLKDGIEASDAEFIFIVSSVNFMVPHVGSGGGDDKQLTLKKDDAWTVFLEEREELIELADAQDQGVFILTGDLHNSFAIQITDNVFEFASGPHNSVNHAPMADEGGRPNTGKFKYGPREADIRWSTYALEDIPRAARLFPHYCVVQINNVFNNPIELDGERWVAFDHPQVIFQFFDAFTGDLRYSETFVKGLEK